MLKVSKRDHAHLTRQGELPNDKTSFQKPNSKLVLKISLKDTSQNIPNVPMHKQTEHIP